MPSLTASNPSVLVVGSINSDLVLRTARLPLAGESLIGTEYQRIAGGKGANQAVAAARLGGTATFVGRTGRDSEGEALLDNLRAEGVCTDFVRQCPQTQTGLAIITVDERGQNSIVVVPGANQEVAVEDVEAALRARSYDALMLQLEIPSATVLAACRLAAARGIPVVLDAGPAQIFPLEELQGVHVLTPNETETFVLSGIQPNTLERARGAGEILLRRSRARAVVLKLGERGALLCDSQGVCEYFPARSVDAVDATAAGDAFTSAMMLEYVRTGDLRQAVLIGNAAGALAAMKFGAQPSLPTMRALDEFCRRQTAHVS
jgi:ribokinase